MIRLVLILKKSLINLAVIVIQLIGEYIMSKNTTDLYDVHEQKLNAIRDKMLNSNISQKLKLKAINNHKIDMVIKEMEKILPSGKLYWDYQFKTGKLMGILRAIVQNVKIKQELLDLTGLTQDHLDMYYDCIGNVPYLTKNNTIDPGRPMKYEDAKEFLTLIGLHFGCIIEDSDLSDINEERWEAMCKQAMEKARATALNNENTLQTTQYEE
jgi:hypothetical protein